MQLLKVFEQGNYSKVIEEWDKLQYQVLQDPDSAFIIAASYFRLGDMQKACEICELIEGPLSNNASFLSMYAAILRRLNLLTKADDVFKKALSIEPESKEIKNNYSNLLIDQQKYEQAVEMLEGILASFPKYEDAIINLERCKSLIAELSDKNPEHVAPENSYKKAFGDPLQEAFSTSEVSRVGGKIGKITASIHELLKTEEPENFEEAQLDMIKLAEQMIKEKQYSEAMAMLGSLRKTSNCLNGQMYKLASDALIGLEKFKDAEIFALMALHNNEELIPVYINLASFSAMRKDQLMAKHWLIEAEKIDKNDGNLIQCKQLLFPSGKAREEDIPFNQFI